MGGRFNVSDTFRGITSGAVATVTKVYQQELVYNSGDILYVENINPVTRANNQQETINIIFNF
jgi:hypothetical protein